MSIWIGANIGNAPLSIGALLCAFDFNSSGTVKVGILNVDSSGGRVVLTKI